MERTQLEAREIRLKALFIAALGGDTAGYRALLEELMLILTAYFERGLRSGRTSGNQVTDLTQDTLLAIHQKRASFDRAEKFTPWLFAIARYKMIDYFRKMQREVLTDDFKKMESWLFTPGDAEDFSTHRDLEHFLAHLTPDHQEVLRLVKLEGHSLAEVSAKLSVSEAALKVRIFRAMKALQAQVKREYS
jgi:RNA polymerase sigma-70 factor (ECF subfamily)